MILLCLQLPVLRVYYLFSFNYVRFLIIYFDYLECVSLIKEKLINTIVKGKDEVAGFAHYVAMYIVFGKAVSNTKSNLNDAQSKYYTHLFTQN